ncbi:MAG: gamma-glutamyl-phosphate reductase, partial [Actinomycetes bacterium]
MSETMSDLSAGPAVEGLADGSERDAVLTVARQARAASTVLGPATRGDKDAAIRAMADALDARAVEVIAANQADVERAVGSGTAAGLVDRL